LAAGLLAVFALPVRPRAALVRAPAVRAAFFDFGRVFDRRADAALSPAALAPAAFDPAAFDPRAAALRALERCGRVRGRLASTLWPSTRMPARPSLSLEALMAT